MPSKKLGHVDGLSRLILKYTEPLEEIEIAVLRDERELSDLLCNTIRELPVTLEDVKKQRRAMISFKKNEKASLVERENKKELVCHLFHSANRYYYTQIEL